MLFDCGEGISTSIENMVFGIKCVFLSHGHYDHIGGVPGLVHTRASARGDKEKELRIYFPEGDSLIEHLRDYVHRIAYNVEYELSWHPLQPDQQASLDDGETLLIRPITTNHLKRVACYGYALLERRRRLKPKYQNLSQKEIIALARQRGRDEITETYEKIILAYGGDSMSLEPDEVAEAEVLFHDATFLDPKDREIETHATVEEALRVAKEARVSALVLFHLSTRYERAQVEEGIRKLASNLGCEVPIWLFMSRKIWRIFPENERETQKATRNSHRT